MPILAGLYFENKSLTNGSEDVDKSEEQRMFCEKNGDVFYFHIIHTHTEDDGALNNVIIINVIYLTLLKLEHKVLSD